jgi:hypothetical protein
LSFASTGGSPKAAVGYHATAGKARKTPGVRSPVNSNRPSFNFNHIPETAARKIRSKQNTSELDQQQVEVEKMYHSLMGS